MGGKVKAQRTKNNSRPSNSSRSAELFGTTLPSFVGFASVSDCGLVPMLPGFSGQETFPSDDPNIDSKYQLVFRKMTKKDSTTKVKALQEFTTLVADTDIETVKTILHFWPRLYGNLSTDVEHRVREAAQQAHASVATKCGKNIAPILRDIAPSWITSQYDTYAPAASIATTSFKNAFPSYKLQEVFNFCQNEVLDYIIKNLTVLTATTMSNSKGYTVEECEAKYQRLVICSLQGYALYLSKVSSIQLKEASNKNSLLLDNAKFWNLHKHKSPNIRSAWFKAIAALLEFAPFLIVTHEQQVATTALHNLDETEPVVIPHLWASVLLVTRNIENWNHLINMEKAFLPKLWKIIKLGGSGNASTIFPHILPLLAKLNQSVLGNEKIKTFYSDFFKYMYTGLMARSIQPNRSDITSIATSYYECLQYIIIQIQTSEIFTDQEEIIKYCIDLVNDHLLTVIDWCLVNNGSFCKCIFSQITFLLSFWSQNSTNNSLYAAILKHFWTELYILIEKTRDCVENIDKFLQTHFDLTQSLKNSQSNRSKNVKVTFSSEDNDIDSTSKNINKSVPYEVELHELAYRLCSMYMQKISETNNPVYITYIENLLKCYGNEELFKKLSGKDSVIKYFDKLSVWLLIAQLRQENIVEIIFMLFQYLNKEEKDILINTLIKFPNEKVQSWVLTRLLSHPLCIEPNIATILAQPSVTNLLIKCANAVINGDTKDNINFLHKCFFQNEFGDILIDKTTCEAIVKVLVIPFNDVSKSNVLDACASFLAQIMPVICSDVEKKSLQNLMFLKFFEFSVNQCISDDLSEDTLWEITTAWQDALSSNDLQLDDSLLQKCSNVIDGKLNKMEDNSIICIDNISEIASKLILCSIEHIENDTEKYNRADTIITTIFNERLTEYKSNIAYMEHLCLFLVAINKSLLLPSINDKIDCVNSLESIHMLLKIAALKFNIIFKITCNVKNYNNTTEVKKNIENGDDECTEDFCDLNENLIKTWSDYIFDNILNSIYVASLGSSYLMYSSNVQAISKNYIFNLSEKMVLFLQNISSTHLSIIKEKLFEKVNTNELFWVFSSLLLTSSDQYSDKDNGLVLLYEDLIAGVKNDDMITKNNIIQVISTKIGQRLLPLAPNLFREPSDILEKIVCLSCFIQNYFQSDYNETNDHKIVTRSFDVLDELYTTCKINKEYLLYNDNITDKTTNKILFVAEIANFFNEIIRAFPAALDNNGWDLIRIALSSWVLTLSKSSESFKLTKVAIFMSSIYKLFSTYSSFIFAEKTKSSSQNMTKMIEEWDHLFAKDVNLILLKCFVKFVKNQDKEEIDRNFIDSISKSITAIDFKYVLIANKIDSKTSMNDLINFALENISNDSHSVRTTCIFIIKQLSNGLISKDMEELNKRNELEMQSKSSSLSNSWHLLHIFEPYIVKHNNNMVEYIEQFSFKSAYFDDYVDISPTKSIPYLLLWESILNICSKAPSELRSIYASFLTDNKYEQVMLTLLFRLMPLDILRNPDSKHMGAAFFAPLTWEQIIEPTILPERYACYMYTQTVRFLPAVVRKWWNDSNPRQKTLVDKITTCSVSPQLCQDELRSLIEKKEKHENMQIIVHTSTREVHATYAIDEARMELIVTLPSNHPLGVVKVESGSQIGGRLQSRVLVMQLTIFLTHQNGSLWDGLSLWRRNLDRKFEGVEECYVCYSVIHQDTCQLPKLSCKTCKKKFHGPCLYKWFSTSNKSTCPICRNIF